MEYFFPLRCSPQEMPAIRGGEKGAHEFRFLARARASRQLTDHISAHQGFGPSGRVGCAGLAQRIDGGEDIPAGIMGHGRPAR